MNLRGLPKADVFAIKTNLAVTYSTSRSDQIRRDKGSAIATALDRSASSTTISYTIGISKHSMPAGKSAQEFVQETPSERT